MMSFDFLALNPSAARALTWNATQWYEDGTSDRWGEGGPEGPEPSTTTLVASEDGRADAAEPRPGYDHHHPADPPAGSGEHEHATPASLWLSLAALVVSLIALAVAISMRRRVRD